MFRFSALSGAALLALAVASPSLAQNDEPDYLVMEPNAEVVFITTGGAEVRADWTEAAKLNLRGGFENQIGEQGYDVTRFDETAERNEDLEQLLLLYEVVSQSLDLRLPHKGGEQGSNYDISLGADTAMLREAYGSDYAVFIDHYSQIESGGVFMTQVMIGVATGYTPPSQNIRLTAGTVIDLNTGDVVDRNVVVFGDPRDETESANIVSRIMSDLALSPVTDAG